MERRKREEKRDSSSDIYHPERLSTRTSVPPVPERKPAVSAHFISADARESNVPTLVHVRITAGVVETLQSDSASMGQRLWKASPGLSAPSLPIFITLDEEESSN
ncbi:unnamed protein product [Pleuronectes platessa]|uniref:Uncharacterized protein n=1 Tax=Pleuronectes platessa TaxID=8262 RepID=A0A9N7UB11_PLEPL|nr:unnamed protein product [Pleuronectes platessa]